MSGGIPVAVGSVKEAVVSALFMPVKGRLQVNPVYVLSTGKSARMPFNTRLGYGEISRPTVQGVLLADRCFIWPCEGEWYEC